MHILRVLAAFVSLGSLGLWLGLGAHTGWSRTSEEVRTLDEVTGIEGIGYRKAFKPGLDFLGAGIAAGGMLAGLSFLFARTKHRTS
ncbi:MAG: hypothetical protein FJ405_09605 [Verrucomicrobia bacterium]|nr:hypothetical protein [Verrucomicrobiota bacterium]